MNPEPTSKDELDEILTLKFAHLMIGKEYPNVGQLVESALSVFRPHINQKCLDIIGEDDDWDKDDTSMRMTYIIRNDLRAEQRAKYTEGIKR
jgi:hypothetical protein